MKRAVWASLCSMIAVTTCLASTAMASSLTEKKQQLSSLQAQSNAASQKLTNEKNKAHALNDSIHSTKAKVQNIADQISSDRQQLQSLTQALQALDNKIQKNNTQLTIDNENLKSMLLANYENGAVPYLDVLFHATNWSDFISRAEAISYIAQHEKDLFNQVQQLTSQLNTEKTQKSVSYKKIQSESSQLQTLEATYVAQQKQQTITLAQLNDQISLSSRSESLVESQIHLTQQEISQIEAATNSDNQKMNNQSYVASARANLKGVNVGALIQYAESYRGDAYQMGADGPSTWDCSSFVQHVFGHFGIGLPRVTWAQYGEGVPVSESNLQPGDLLFFQTYAPGASHVGIYIGGGQMINAEDAGVMVTGVFSGGAASYWGPKFIGARDIIRH